MGKWISFTRENNEKKAVSTYIPLDQVVSIDDTNWEYDETPILYIGMTNSTRHTLKMTEVNIDRFYLRLDDMLQHNDKNLIDISDLL